MISDTWVRGVHIRAYYSADYQDADSTYEFVAAWKKSKARIRDLGSLVRRSRGLFLAKFAYAVDNNNAARFAGGGTSYPLAP